jgi:Flp pilus assembly pilin Flp
VEKLCLRELTIMFRGGIITYTVRPKRNLFRVSGGYMVQFLCDIWSDEQGQDIAEYAVMLAVILVLVIGTVRLIGGNANNAFNTVASTLQ